MPNAGTEELEAERTIARKVAGRVDHDRLQRDVVMPSIDLAKGEQRTPEWRAEINEMGEVPVLDHKGKRLAQSGVILTYLSDLTGKFKPSGEDEKLEALRWILFDNHKFTSHFATYRFLKAFGNAAPDPTIMKYLRGRMDNAFSIVDKHLADRSFMLGDRPTIVDFSLAGYVYYPADETGFDISAAFPAVHAWRERLAALPGWKPPYEMMPVGSDLRVGMRRPA